MISSTTVATLRVINACRVQAKTTLTIIRNATGARIKYWYMYMYVVMNDDSLEIFLKHVDDAFLALVTHAQP